MNSKASGFFDSILYGRRAKGIYGKRKAVLGWLLSGNNVT